MIGMGESESLSGNDYTVSIPLVMHQLSNKILVCIKTKTQV